MKSNFVFDFDDTLADSGEYSRFCFAQTIKAFYPDTNTKLLNDLHVANPGLTVEDFYKLIITELKLEVAVEELVALDQKMQMEGLDKMPIFTSARDVMIMLKARGKSLHICTNRHLNTLLPILDKSELTPFFSSIISCNDVGYKKPDPKCLNDLIAEHGNDKSSYIYFGDSRVDYEFAKNAGIDFVIVDQYLNDKKFFAMIIQMFL